jgi:hypothetical protein
MFEAIDWAADKEPAIVAKLGDTLKTNSIKVSSESIQTNKLDYASLSPNRNNLSSKSKPLFGSASATKPLFGAFSGAPAPVSDNNEMSLPYRKLLIHFDLGCLWKRSCNFRC